ncbi:MAG TPA: hypothetical protein VGD78_21210, partial [Chthoniobacterales bacterium]
MRSSPAVIPVWGGIGLFVASGLQYIAWQFDLAWLRRPIPAFPAIFPWTVIGFSGTSVLIILLASAVRTGSAGFQAAAKVIGVAIGLVSLAFLAEYLLGQPVSAFDALLFKHLLFKAGGSFPGRPAQQTCTTFLLLAIAALVFDRKDKRRIEVFQAVVALAMFCPLLAIFGYVLFATVFQTLGGTPTTEMAVPTLVLFCIAGVAFLSFFPKEGLLSLLLGNDLAATTIRRLVPTVVLVPLALGWIL